MSLATGIVRHKFENYIRNVWKHKVANNKNYQKWSGRFGRKKLLELIKIKNEQNSIFATTGE